LPCLADGGQRDIGPRGAEGHRRVGWVDADRLVGLAKEVAADGGHSEQGPEQEERGGRQENRTLRPLCGPTDRGIDCGVDGSPPAYRREQVWVTHRTA
jgi:hypothetical protein